MWVDGGEMREIEMRGGEEGKTTKTHSQKRKNKRKNLKRKKDTTQLSEAQQHQHTMVAIKRSSF